MSQDMLGREEALRAMLFDPLGELAVRLTGPDRDEWKEATERFLRRENPWIEPRKLLKYLGLVSVGSRDGLLPADRATFDPRDYFKLIDLQVGKAQISSVDYRFFELFGPEKRVAHSTLQLYELTASARGTPLNKAINKEGKGADLTVSLGQVWDLLGGWRNRSQLATNSNAEIPWRENLFPVMDKHGKPWTLVLWARPQSIPVRWDIHVLPQSCSDRNRRGSWLFLRH